MEDISFGVIPVSKTSSRYLVVKQKNGYWCFPKGHAEGLESAVEAALREFQEETGLNQCDINPDPTYTEKYTYQVDGTTYHKTNYYFIGLTEEAEPKPDNEETVEAKWLNYEEALETFSFEDRKNILREAHTFLQKK
jgi:bis(5'-nucleosidyl)-tetraphosphatase